MLSVLSVAEVESSTFVSEACFVLAVLLVPTLFGVSFLPVFVFGFDELLEGDFFDDFLLFDVVFFFSGRAEFSSFFGALAEAFAGGAVLSVGVSAASDLPLAEAS